MAKPPRKKVRRTLRALTDEAGLTTPKPIEQKAAKKRPVKPPRKR